MSITLGSITFDPAHTDIREKLEEIGGRNQRRIEIAGLIVSESSIAAIEARLDAILDAASQEDYGAALSLRPGRRLWVRRAAFSRELAREALAASFILVLESKSPFEESETLTAVPWSIAASGATKTLASDGNVHSLPTITLVAVGNVVNPSFSDATCTITYSGALANGQTLVFNADAGIVSLDGLDVTPYSSGEFPRIAPEGTTLVYTDAVASSHTASATVAFRSRWW